MKKLLMMTFVSLAMLATVSCSKDKDKDNNTTPSVTGTQWECVHTFSIMSVPLTITADLDFKTDDMCLVNFELPSTIAALLPDDMQLPSSGEFGYTFDGSKLVIATENSLIGNIELDYVNDKMLIWTVPENFRSILGTGELVFHRK
jgi:hypothetical protein